MHAVDHLGYLYLDLKLSIGPQYMRDVASYFYWEMLTKRISSCTIIQDWLPLVKRYSSFYVPMGFQMLRSKGMILMLMMLAVYSSKLLL